MPKAVYTRRFKAGKFNYSTKAWMDESNCVIIHQSERHESSRESVNNVVQLPFSEFIKMCKTLDITLEEP